MGLKEEIFEKLGIAVDESDPSTPDGVEKLAMAASAVRNLNEGTDISEDIYKLGEVGQIGFGVATARTEDYQSVGLVPLTGHDNVLSSNYGNYLHAYSGAIMVHIPKHYFKIEGNEFSFSTTAKAGFVLERTFVNADKEMNGIFIAKFQGTNNNGVFSAQRGKDPLSTSASHNPIGDLNGSPSNTNGGLYQAVKTMDSKAFLTPVYAYAMMARLAKAHGEVAQSTSACAYIDVLPKLPKGNNNNALGDINDPSVTFVGSGYSNCANTGSGENFAKTTHNGQECGIADINGNMREAVSALIRTSADGFLTLKESIDIKAIQNDTDAYTVSNYDAIDISDLVDSNAGWISLGNQANQVFGFSQDRNEDSYKRTAFGIPLAMGVSAEGTTEFGNDGFYRFLVDDMACRCGGGWGSSLDAGSFAVHLGSFRTSSDAIVGSRASIYPN